MKNGDTERARFACKARATRPDLPLPVRSVWDRLETLLAYSHRHSWLAWAPETPTGAIPTLAGRRTGGGKLNPTISHDDRRFPRDAS
jgi:hypothetical protein